MLSLSMLRKMQKGTCSLLWEERGTLGLTSSSPSPGHRGPAQASLAVMPAAGPRGPGEPRQGPQPHAVPSQSCTVTYVLTRGTGGTTPATLPTPWWPLAQPGSTGLREAVRKALGGSPGWKVTAAFQSRRPNRPPYKQGYI